MKHLALALVSLAAVMYPPSLAESAPSGTEADEDHLAVLWTSGEREVFTKVVYPYCLNAKKRGWWKQVTLIVWGPSSRLLSSDEELQDGIRELGKADVRLTACRWCATPAPARPPTSRRRSATNTRAPRTAGSWPPPAARARK